MPNCVSHPSTVLPSGVAITPALQTSRCRDRDCARKAEQTSRTDCRLSSCHGQQGDAALRSTTVCGSVSTTTTTTAYHTVSTTTTTTSTTPLDVSTHRLPLDHVSHWQEQVSARPVQRAGGLHSNAVGGAGDEDHLVAPLPYQPSSSMI